MQAALIIRTFLASPSDVQPERDEACRVIAEWNAVNSLDRSAIIEPVRIETHAELELGAHPQEIINRQLLGRCDFLIAAFWSRIGTPTNKEKSGTIHEIKEFAKTKGSENVKLFFSEKPFPSSIDPDELRAINDFKEEMRTAGLYRRFADTSGFGRDLRNQLDLVMNKILNTVEARKAWSEKAMVDAEDKLAIDKKKELQRLELEHKLVAHNSHIANMENIAGKRLR